MTRRTKYKIAEGTVSEPKRIYVRVGRHNEYGRLSLPACLIGKIVEVVIPDVPFGDEVIGNGEPPVKSTRKVGKNCCSECGKCMNSEQAVGCSEATTDAGSEATTDAGSEATSDATSDSSADVPTESLTDDSELIDDLGTKSDAESEVVEEPQGGEEVAEQVES